MNERTSLSFSAETRRQIEELVEAWGEPGLSNAVARAVQQAHDRMLVSIHTWKRLLETGLYDDPFHKFITLPEAEKSKLLIRLHRRKQNAN